MTCAEPTVTTIGEFARRLDALQMPGLPSSSPEHERLILEMLWTYRVPLAALFNASIRKPVVPCVGCGLERP